jgi:hypothetical protein
MRLIAAGCSGLALGSVQGCSAPPRVASVPPQRIDDLGTPASSVWPLADQYPQPDLSDGRLIGQRTGIRPYRRGSVRVEVQDLAGKRVIHNYGHGGAGITLAPASSAEAIDLLEATSPESGSTIAVLGAGIVGMTTADLLRDRGYSVRIYTEHITPNTTSDVAGGQFAPATVAIGGSERRDRWMCVASDYYLPRAGTGCGVDRVINFTVGDAGGALRHLPDDHFQRRSLNRLPIDGVNQSGGAYETLVIAPPIYLRWLMERLIARRVTFRLQRIASPSDVADLPEQAVINCMGLGAKAVFGDDQLIPIRGRLLMLEPQPLGYLLSHPRGYLFSRPDAVVLGGTYDRGQTDSTEDPRVTGELLERHQLFFTSG